MGLDHLNGSPTEIEGDDPQFCNASFRLPVEYFPVGRGSCTLPPGHNGCHSQNILGRQFYQH